MIFRVKSCALNTFLVLLKTISLTIFITSCNLNNEHNIPTVAIDKVAAADNAVVLVIQDPRPLHKQIGSGTPLYSNRLAYDSDPLLTRSARQLAKDFNVEFLFHWPIKSQRLLCVVLKTNDSTQLIKQAIGDSRVLLAQKFNTFESLSHSLDKLTPKKNIIKHTYDGSGKTIKIFLVDTGLDKKHEDLRGAKITEVDFVGKELGLSNEIHGTSVVGVLAAQPMNGIGISGIAPDAKITVARACWQLKRQSSKAKCNTLTITAALDYALQHDFDLVNFSLSGPVDPLLEMLLTKLIAKGALVVAAYDPNRSRTERFPQWRASGGVLFAKGDNLNNTELAQWEVLAPYSAVSLIPNNGYDLVAGHSIASPHITGLAAIFLEKTPAIEPQVLLKKIHSAQFINQPALEL